MFMNCIGMIAAMITLLVVFTWMTSRADAEIIRALVLGLLFLVFLCFVLSLLIRLPFQHLRSALASLSAIVFVIFGVLYALPLIEAYRRGYDVSGSLFHPIVFGSLGLAVILLTHNRHRGR